MTTETVKIQARNGEFDVPIDILEIKNGDYHPQMREYFEYDFSKKTESKMKFKYVEKGFGYYTDFKIAKVVIQIPKNITKNGIIIAKNEILEFSKLLNPIYFSISEYTNAEFGCYNLVKDNIYVIIKQVYHIQSVVYQSDSLEKIIKYISDELYYDVETNDPDEEKISLTEQEAGDIINMISISYFEGYEINQDLLNKISNTFPNLTKKISDLLVKINKVM